MCMVGIADGLLQIFSLVIKLFFLDVIMISGDFVQSTCMPKWLTFQK